MSFKRPSWDRSIFSQTPKCKLDPDASDQHQVKVRLPRCSLHWFNVSEIVGKIPVVCYQYILLGHIVSPIIYLPVFARTSLQSTVSHWAMLVFLSLLSPCKLAAYIQTGSHCSALCHFFAPTSLLPQPARQTLEVCLGMCLPNMAMNLDPAY